jgi:hypothetical protein
MKPRKYRYIGPDNVLGRPIKNGDILFENSVNPRAFTNYKLNEFYGNGYGNDLDFFHRNGGRLELIPLSKLEKVLK